MLLTHSNKPLVIYEQQKPRYVEQVRKPLLMMLKRPLTRHTTLILILIRAIILRH